MCVCLSLIFSGMRLGADSQFSDFLDGLGPAQLVGRQTLATPAMGKSIFLYIYKLKSKIVKYASVKNFEKCNFLKHFLFFTFNLFCFVGDVQIGLMDKKGQLEVEVIRARGLTPKPGSKSLPGESVPTFN